MSDTLAQFATQKCLQQGFFVEISILLILEKEKSNTCEVKCNLMLTFSEYVGGSRNKKYLHAIAI